MIGGVAGIAVTEAGAAAEGVIGAVSRRITVGVGVGVGIAATVGKGVDAGKWPPPAKDGVPDSVT